MSESPDDDWLNDFEKLYGERLKKFFGENIRRDWWVYVAPLNYWNNNLSRNVLETIPELVDVIDEKDRVFVTILVPGLQLSTLEVKFIHLKNRNPCKGARKRAHSRVIGQHLVEVKGIRLKERKFNYGIGVHRDLTQCRHVINYKNGILTIEFEIQE